MPSALPRAPFALDPDPPAAFPAAATIQSILDEWVAKKRAVGLVVATRDARGKTRVYHAGSSGRAGVPLTGDTVFEIASVTKTFTAALLADRVVRGEVALDDPVARYLPRSVRVPERDGKRITLLDLATHTSGLPGAGAHPHPADPKNPWADFTVERMYDVLARFTLPRPIGSEYEYSNLGVGLLGHALALHAGKGWEALVRERVLGPLRLKDTRVELTRPMRTRMAAAHDKYGRVTPYWDIPAIPGMGALRSTADDLMRFLVANLEPERSPLGRALALTHVPRRPAWSSETRMGLTWQLGNAHNLDLVRHSGGTSGSASFIGYDSRRRLSVVVLSNAPFPVFDIGLHLIDPRNPLEIPPVGRT